MVNGDSGASGHAVFPDIYSEKEHDGVIRRCGWGDARAILQFAPKTQSVVACYLRAENNSGMLRVASFE